jgi:hypothetical protein
MFAEYKLTPINYKQDWSVRVFADDGAGRPLEYIECWWGDDINNSRIIPNNMPVDMPDYAINLNGTVVTYPEACLTVVADYPGDSYRYGRRYWTVEPVTTGPLPRRNQSVNLSFLVADLVIVPGSLRTVGGGNLSKNQPSIQVTVRNSGTAICNDLAISAYWDVLGPDGDVADSGYSSHTVTHLGPGAQETVKFSLAGEIEMGVLAVVDVEIDHSTFASVYIIESNYSNNLATANFTISPAAGTQGGRETANAPYEPPWGAIGGVIIVILGAVYLAGRSAGRAIRRREELAGKALPSGQLKEALGARMSAAPAAATQAAEANPSGEKPGPEAPAAPKRPRCPSCMSPLDRRGKRMLVCSECGYMTFDEN